MIDRPRRYENTAVKSASNDDGAIMIIAILIVTVVALVAGALLTRGDGSLRATVALRQVAGASYAADAAAQIALNDLRTGYWDGSVPKTKPTWAFVNLAGDGCFGRNSTNSILTPDSDLMLGEFYPAPLSSGGVGTSAYVTCAPEVATGIQGTARLVTDANSPGDAIIITGNGGEDGLRSDNKPLTVRGGVRVRTNINSNKFNPPSVQVNDANLSAASCTASNTIGVTAGFQKVCNGSVAFVDPLTYVSDLLTIPGLAPAPTCGTNWLIFSPGYYDDLRAIQTWTTGCNKNYWFMPGSYYFDFHNNGALVSSTQVDPLYNAGISASYPSTGNEWTITGRSVLGGTPLGTNRLPLSVGVPPPAAGSNVNIPIGKACHSPIDDAGASGVQFIFGGDSRINFGDSAKVELCASYRKNTPPIVFFEYAGGGNPMVNQSLTGNGALIPSGTPTATAGPGTDTSTFTPVSALALRDNVPANGTASWIRSSAASGLGAASETRTVTMSGFTLPSAISTGAVLKSAQLVVTHKAASSAGGATPPTIRITPTGGTPSAAINLTKPASLTPDTVVFNSSTNAAVFNALSKRIHDGTYNGSSIDFTATSARGLTTLLDSARLEFEYYVPTLRGPGAITNNCTTTVGGSGCYIIETDTKSQVYLQGTTYAPAGRIHLTVANTVGQVFRWGVIARSLYANLNGAAPPGALIELPDNSPGFGVDGTLVQLTIHVCPRSTTCDANGQVELKVRAQIWDEDGNPDTITDRRVSILNWSHTR